MAERLGTKLSFYETSNINDVTRAILNSFIEKLDNDKKHKTLTSE